MKIKEKCTKEECYRWIGDDSPKEVVSMCPDLKIKSFRPYCRRGYEVREYVLGQTYMRVDKLKRKKK